MSCQKASQGICLFFCFQENTSRHFKGEEQNSLNWKSYVPVSQEKLWNSSLYGTAAPQKINTIPKYTDAIYVTTDPCP